MRPDRTPLWVLGRGGLLGRALLRVCSGARLFAHEPVDWTSSAAPGHARELATRFLAEARDDDADPVVVWAAGAGIIGTSLDDLERETEVLAGVLDGLQGGRPTTVVLASSAGGVYGHSTHLPISEHTPEAPRSDYGMNKLAQETLVRDWASATGGRAILCRISNLYGPGQDLSKPQGLVSQLCRSTLMREPLRVFVPLDTLRDYLYVDDCARRMAAMIAASGRLDPGRPVTKILATGTSISIGALVGEARRVLGRSPLVVMARSSVSTQHGSRLAFRSVVWPEVDTGSLTPLPVGLHRTMSGVLSQLASGTLSG